MKSRFEGRNFFVAVISIVYGILTLNSIEFSGDAIINAYDTNDWLAIALNVANPLFTTIDKIQKNEFSVKNYLVSTNFKVNIVTIITIVAGIYFEEKTASAIGIFVINLINIFYHYDRDRSSTV